MAVITLENINLSVDEFICTLTELSLLHKLKDANAIVIKPNLAAGSYVHPDSHVVSDKQYLKQLIECICEINLHGKIYIAESDSTGYGYAFLKFKNLGFYELISDRVELLDLSRDILVKLEKQNFKYFNTIDKQLWLSKTLVDSDFFISLSNLKTHSITKFTGACKNLFGVLPVMNKSVMHPKIHKVVHDLTLAVPPHLSITDGFFSMERNGPVGGIKRKTNKRFYGNNAYEHDCYCSSFININPKSVGYLKLLSKESSIKFNKPVLEVRFQLPDKLLRLNNYIGLKIQLLGSSIMELGHRIHSAGTPIQMLIAIFRPMLLKFIPLSTLKKIKNLISNNE